MNTETKYQMEDFFLKSERTTCKTTERFFFFLNRNMRRKRKYIFIYKFEKIAYTHKSAFDRLIRFSFSKTICYFDVFR